MSREYAYVTTTGYCTTVAIDMADAMREDASYKTSLVVANFVELFGRTLLNLVSLQEAGDCGVDPEDFAPHIDKLIKELKQAKKRIPHLIEDGNLIAAAPESETTP